MRCYLIVVAMIAVYLLVNGAICGEQTQVLAYYEQPTISLSVPSSISFPMYVDADMNTVEDHLVATSDSSWQVTVEDISGSGHNWYLCDSVTGTPLKNRMNITHSTYTVPGIPGSEQNVIAEGDPTTGTTIPIRLEQKPDPSDNTELTYWMTMEFTISTAVT